MKVYNIKKQVVETAKQITVENEYGRLVTLSPANVRPERLRTFGLLPVVEKPVLFHSIEDMGDNFETEGEVVDGTYELTYIPTGLSIEDARNVLRNNLSTYFMQVVQRPRVKIEEDFYVDGSQADLGYYIVGRKYKVPVVKDADGKLHKVTDKDYETIITSIEKNGLRLFQVKWAIEQEINLLSTINECIQFSKEASRHKAMFEPE